MNKNEKNKLILALNYIYRALYTTYKSIHLVNNC